jgi:hypothetical protein
LKRDVNEWVCRRVRGNGHGQAQVVFNDSVAALGVGVGAAGPGDRVAAGASIEACPQHAAGICLFEQAFERVDVGLDVLMDHRQRHGYPEADLVRSADGFDTEYL